MTDLSTDNSGGNMHDQRVISERRSENKAILEELRYEITKVRDRVFNGLGKDIREEVNKELAGLRNLVIGILVALLLSLAGIVVEGRLSSQQASSENDRNYKAIVDVGAKLEEHIILTEPKK